MIMIQLEDSMRQGVCRILLSAVLLLASFGLNGCGSGDLLDEPGQRYEAYMVVEDAGEEVLTIDTVQADCDPELGTVDPEPFTDTLGIINVSVDAGAPGITLQRYRLQYIPLQSPDGTGQLVLPPNLIDPGFGNFPFDVASGGSAEFTITLLGVETKEEYEYLKSLDASLADLFFSRYILRVTLYVVDEFDEEREIVVERTVWLGPYDNC